MVFTVVNQLFLFCYSHIFARPILLVCTAYLENLPLFYKLFVHLFADLEQVN